MSNAGGLWDNAKSTLNPATSAARAATHKAAVIGDTVGDPFKDTAGPSINTQITVVSLVSSLAAVCSSPIPSLKQAQRGPGCCRGLFTAAAYRSSTRAVLFA
ncbi:MAG: sodium/proton-translocating pyrophosphatase [Ruthenibacterium lactatiformans]